MKKYRRNSNSENSGQGDEKKAEAGVGGCFYVVWAAVFVGVCGRWG